MKCPVSRLTCGPKIQSLNDMIYGIVSQTNANFRQSTKTLIMNHLQQLDVPFYGEQFKEKQIRKLFGKTSSQLKSMQH